MADMLKNAHSSRAESWTEKQS